MLACYDQSVATGAARTRSLTGKTCGPIALGTGQFEVLEQLGLALADVVAQRKLSAWGDFVLGEMRKGKSEAEIIAVLIEKTQPELQRIARDAHALQRYEIASNYSMTVQGYMRYWRKKHPERL